MLEMNSDLDPEFSPNSFPRRDFSDLGPKGAPYPNGSPPYRNGPPPYANGPPPHGLQGALHRFLVGSPDRNCG